MSSTLARAVLAAIDDGVEVRLRRPSIPIAGHDLEVVLETYVGDRRLSWKNVVSREELTSLAGDASLAFTVDVGTDAIRNAPTDRLEEPRR